MRLTPKRKVDSEEFKSNVNHTHHQRAGLHRALGITFISGSGTAGVDNTAQAVKSLTLPKNSLTQLGDRIRIRCYWSGDTGGNITGTITFNGVTVSHTTDSGGTSLQLNEVYLHYIDDTHANIIEDESGALGALSAPNVSGFNWDNDQTIALNQSAVLNNHIILYALIIDILPKGDNNG